MYIYIKLSLYMYHIQNPLFCDGCRSSALAVSREWSRIRKAAFAFFKLKHVYIELIRGVFETYEFEAPFRSKPP